MLYLILYLTEFKNLQLYMGYTRPYIGTRFITLIKSKLFVLD